VLRLEEVLKHELHGPGGKYKSNYSVTFWDAIQESINYSTSSRSLLQQFATNTPSPINEVSAIAKSQLKKLIREVNDRRDGLQTPEGKGRSYLLSALNQHLILPLFTLISKNNALLKEWYSEHALLCSYEDVSMLLSLLAGMQDLSFALPEQSPVLDSASWASYVLPAEPAQPV
jgi:hypothetical protein